MLTSIELFHEDEECYYDIEVEFEFSAYYTPARINCRVEDSYPEEGDSEFEILVVKLDGKEVEMSFINSNIKKTINDSVEEWVSENGLEAIEEHNDECRAEAQYEARYDY